MATSGLEIGDGADACICEMELLPTEVGRTGALSELDVLDVLAAAFAVQRKAVANDLNNLGVRAIGKRVGGFAGRKVAAVLHGAFDELVGIESLVRLFDEGIGDIGFANKDDGVEMMRQGAKLTDLRAGKSHDYSRFLLFSIVFELVHDSALRVRGQKRARFGFGAPYWPRGAQATNAQRTSRLWSSI